MRASSKGSAAIAALPTFFGDSGAAVAISHRDIICADSFRIFVCTVRSHMAQSLCSQ
jgi:hypothetical protein